MFSTAGNVLQVINSSSAVSPLLSHPRTLEDTSIDGNLPSPRGPAHSERINTRVLMVTDRTGPFESRHSALEFQLFFGSDVNAVSEPDVF